MSTQRNKLVKSILKETLIALAFYSIKKLMDKYERERRVSKYGSA